MAQEKHWPQVINLWILELGMRQYFFYSLEFLRQRVKTYMYASSCQLNRRRQINGVQAPCVVDPLIFLH